MGIVYNRKSGMQNIPHDRQIKHQQVSRKIGKGYNKKAPCHRMISRLQTVKVLTPQNIRFLRSLGLQVRRNA